jgi:tetratricopeptide (TPR) repeat protein
MNAQALAHYRQGMQKWAAGDLKGAQAAFTQATKADPNAFQAFYSLGAVQERLGSSAALSNYEKAFKAESKYDRAIVAYGLLKAKKGKLSEAETFLKKHRAKLPKSAGITAALAEVKSLQRDTATAQELASEALKIDPSFAPAMMTIARDHYRNRRLDLALYALRAVLDGFGGDNPARDENNAEGYLLRAIILSEQDNRVGAMENYRKAIQLRPDLTDARIKLATYMLESGAANEALPMLQQALRYDRRNLPAHLALGDAYRLTGKYMKAKAEFDWVSRQDSSMAEVHYNLGLLYMFAPKGQIKGMNEKQQVLAAIKHFNKFKELSSKTQGGDVDELLKQANLKKAEIEMLEKANQPVQPVPVPAPAPSK